MKKDGLHTHLYSYVATNRKVHTYMHDGKLQRITQLMRWYVYVHVLCHFIILFNFY